MKIITVLAGAIAIAAATWAATVHWATPATAAMSKPSIQSATLPAKIEYAAASDLNYDLMAKALIDRNVLNLKNHTNIKGSAPPETKAVLVDYLADVRRIDDQLGKAILTNDSKTFEATILPAIAAASQKFNKSGVDKALRALAGGDHEQDWCTSADRKIFEIGIAFFNGNIDLSINHELMKYRSLRKICSTYIGML